MYLTVLGCCGPYPRGGEATSGYLITSDSGKTRIAIDLGSGVLSRLNEKIRVENELDALILTHLHFDHAADVPVLGYQLDFTSRESLKVICPDTPEEIRNLYKGKLDLYPAKDTRIGEFRIEFIKVRHPVETYAVKVYGDDACFVYTGDTNVCTEINLFADGCDLLLADCGHSNRDWNDKKPHMSPETCAQLAKDCRAGQLVLTHFSPLYDREELVDDARRIFPDTIPAEAGMRIRI